MKLQRKILYLVAADDAPKLPVRFTGLDLSNYSSIKMRIKYENNNRLEKDVTPVGASDAELGHVDWDSGDLIVGEHEAEFILTQVSDSKVLTLPRYKTVLLYIRKKLG